MWECGLAYVVSGSYFMPYNGLFIDLGLLETVKTIFWLLKHIAYKVLFQEWHIYSLQHDIGKYLT